MIWQQLQTHDLNNSREELERVGKLERQGCHLAGSEVRLLCLNVLFKPEDTPVVSFIPLSSSHPCLHKPAHFTSDRPVR